MYNKKKVLTVTPVYNEREPIKNAIVSWVKMLKLTILGVG